MNRSDLFMTALQNLWARKSRTAFNIFGIVVSCSMLLLVFAGTRGARDGLMNMFSQSEFAQHFAITPGRNRPPNSTATQPPETDLGKGIGKERMERISEKLSDAWKKKNIPLARVTFEKIDELRELPGIASVLPNQSLRAHMTIGDQKASASVSCFSTESSNLAARIIAGNKPQPDSSRGKVWVDEYRAWRLGYKTDEELAELVGTKIQLRFVIPTSKPSPSMQRFISVFGARNVVESEVMVDTFRKLFADLDQTSLSEIEKQGILAAATKLGLDVPTPEQASTNDTRFTIREFEIAGIVKPIERSTGDLFQLARANRSNDLTIDWRDFQAIDQATHPKRTYFYSIATVENADNLAEAVALVENAGFETRSAIEILTKAEEELGKVRLIVAAIALVILLIASVGIMNTMIIAVMERTPEFGIMKAVGSKDSDIRWLMLIEAAMTGILGAIVSLGAARLIDSVVSQFARRYIEDRIREDFDFRVFVYSFSDILIVAAIAVFICMLASLIPSRRAARLDPIEAMK